MAVGDIQGCFSTLEKLLREVNFNSGQDQLWVCGDLVNRGPENLETLRFLKSLGKRCVSVLGNHDLHLLAIAMGGHNLKRHDTIDDILDAPDRETLLKWLRKRPLLHYCPKLDTAMVHAGIPPIWDLSKALRRSAEVEAMLQSDEHLSFFADHMYGNLPAVWSKDLRGWPRLRMITNYFTRMRFCNAEGRLDLGTKSGPGTQPEGYAPWFEFPNQLGKTEVVFGHWAALMGETRHKRIHALDTGCVWGSALTCMDIESGERFSVDPD
ncbi:symmetrical bis(5'-nucleosyl)-tetraphosphatase [Spongorhabdus nitratireducens]